MKRVCQKCRTKYDDARQNTICPHERFITVANARQKDLAFSLLRKPLAFNHTEEGSPLHIESIGHDGMVTIRGMAGEFAPHLFRVIAVEA